MRSSFAFAMLALAGGSTASPFDPVKPDSSSVITTYSDSVEKSVSKASLFSTTADDSPTTTPLASTANPFGLLFHPGFPHPPNILHPVTTPRIHIPSGHSTPPPIITSPKPSSPSRSGNTTPPPVTTSRQNSSIVTSNPSSSQISSEVTTIPVTTVSSVGVTTIVTTITSFVPCSTPVATSGTTTFFSTSVTLTTFCSTITVPTTFFTTICPACTDLPLPSPPITTTVLPPPPPPVITTFSTAVEVESCHRCAVIGVTTIIPEVIGTCPPAQTVIFTLVVQTVTVTAPAPGESVVTTEEVPPPTKSRPSDTTPQPPSPISNSPGISSITPIITPVLSSPLPPNISEKSSQKSSPSGNTISSHTSRNSTMHITRKHKTTPRLPTTTPPIPYQH